MPYDLDLLQSDVAQVQNDAAGFGTGRLIAENLVLTSAHVLRDPNEVLGDGALKLDGWDVRLFKDRTADGHWPFRTGGRVVWHGGISSLDMALIALGGASSICPSLGLRIAAVTANNPHAIEARGFPRASKNLNDAEKPRDLTPAFGLLTGADSRNPLRFGVDVSDLPNKPHKDWLGMSGSAVTLRDWPEPGTLWVYGVVKQVPANFDGQLEVARLVDAWQDERFRRLLLAAGVADSAAEDPTLRLLEQFHQRSVTQDAVELLRLLRTTRTTFDAQARVRDELVFRLSERLVLHPRRPPPYDEIFAEHHAGMAILERRRFDFIRSLTVNVLHDCNRRALAVIEESSKLAAIAPGIDALRVHLRIWLAKFDSVFAGSPDMCLLYVGPEEGVPFPETVERGLWDWLQGQPDGPAASLGDKPPPRPEFTEGGGDLTPAESARYDYLQSRWKARRLDELYREREAVDCYPWEKHRSAPGKEYDRLRVAAFHPSIPAGHADALAALAERAERSRREAGTTAEPEPADAKWQPPPKLPEPEGPREPPPPPPPGSVEELWRRLEQEHRDTGLTPEIVGRVVEKFVMKLEAQLADRNVTIELSSAAKEWLVERGYDRCRVTSLYGARQLARAMEDYIKKPLAEELLFGKLVKGGSVKVTLKDGKLDFEIFEAQMQALPKPDEDGDGGVDREEIEA